MDNREMIISLNAKLAPYLSASLSKLPVTPLITKGNVVFIRPEIITTFTKNGPNILELHNGFIAEDIYLSRQNKSIVTMKSLLQVQNPLLKQNIRYTLYANFLYVAANYKPSLFENLENFYDEQL